METPPAPGEFLLVMPYTPGNSVGCLADNRQTNSIDSRHIGNTMQHVAPEFEEKEGSMTGKIVLFSLALLAAVGCASQPAATVTAPAAATVTAPAAAAVSEQCIRMYPSYSQAGRMYRGTRMSSIPHTRAVIATNFFILKPLPRHRNQQGCRI